MSFIINKEKRKQKWQTFIPDNKTHNLIHKSSVFSYLIFSKSRERKPWSQSLNNDIKATQMPKLQKDRDEHL